MPNKKNVDISLLVLCLIVPSLFLGTVFTVKVAVADDDDDDDGISKKDLGVTNIKNLGDKIEGIELLTRGSVTFGNIITCPALLTCTGTDKDDIIYAGAMEQVFALDGKDIVYGGLSNQIYGGDDEDLLIAGAGKGYVDGGPDDDVLIAGLGNALLTGGSGNDKLFAGPATSVMYGGTGANHFDCPLSALGLARSVVMDYNPSNGDTLSGQCKIVNTIGDSNSNAGPQVLPDTGDSPESSQTVPGTPIPLG